MLFRHDAAARHCVLLSSLASIVVFPIIATAFNDLGVVQVSIPDLFSTNIRWDDECQEVDHGEAQREFISENQPSSTEFLSASRNKPVIAPEVSSKKSMDLISSSAVSTNISESSKPAVFRDGVITIVFAIWMAGSTIFLINLLRSFILLEGIRRRAQALDIDQYSPVLEDVKNRLKVDKLPKIAISNEVQTPVAFGIIRPCIIVPRSALQQFDHCVLCDSIIHESAHVLRYDPLVVLVQMLAAAVYWPIPFVHRLNRSLVRAREEVCDNFVLAHSEPADYGATLLYMAELANGRQALSTSVGILNWPGSLEDRIMGIVDKKRVMTTKNSAVFTLTVFALFFLFASALCCTNIAFGIQAYEEDVQGKQRPSGLLGGSIDKQPESSDGVLPALQSTACSVDDIEISVDLDRPDFEQEELDRWHAHYYRTAQKYYMFTDERPDKPFELVEKPLQNYTDFEAQAQQHGSILLWTKGHRPQVVAAFWSATGGSNDRRVAHEFHSLIDEPLQAFVDGKKVWYPRSGGMDFQPIAEPSVVAPTRPLRTAQLRRLVRNFSAFHDRTGEEKKLTLVETPIYRYQEQPGSDTDGALFVFYYEQDPEVLLLVESEQTEKGLRWRFSPVRFTEVPARMTYLDADVWHATRAKFVGNFLNLESDPYHGTWYEHHGLMLQDSVQDSDRELPKIP